MVAASALSILQGPVYLTQNQYAADVIAAMNTRPNWVQASYIDTAVQDLCDAGLWTKLGYLAVFAHGQDLQGALINWINPFGVAGTAVNSPTFTVGKGFRGDGSTGYVDGGIPFSSIPGFTQNSAHFGAMMVFSNDGIAGSGAISASQPVIGRSTGLAFTRLNTNTADTIDAVPTNTLTHICLSRPNSAGYERHIDGVQVTSAVRGSVAPTSSNIGALRINTTIFASINVYARAIHAGTYLTPAEVATLYSILYPLMVSVGAHVL